MEADLRSLAGLIWAFTRAHVRRVLEYRSSFFIGAAAILSGHVVRLLMLWVIFSQVPSLAGWSPLHVLYLYGYVSLVWACYHLLFLNTFRVEFLVRDATLDRYLIRPIPPIVHVMLHYFDDDAIGDFIPAIGCLVFASGKLGVVYSWNSVAVLLLGVAGGTLVYFGINLVLCSWSFWFVKSRALMGLFGEVRRFSDFPLATYPVGLQLVLTLAVPIAFAGYFPAEQVLRLADGAWLAWLALPVGLATCGVGLLVWHAGLDRYQGAGS